MKLTNQDEDMIKATEIEKSWIGKLNEFSKEILRLKGENKQDRNSFKESLHISNITIRTLEHENTKLKETLLDVMIQSCSYTPMDCSFQQIDNRCTSAYEDACILLEKEGLLEKVNDRIYKVMNK